MSAPGSYTLSATSPGLTAATSAAFTVTTPVKLAFLVQPSNALTGAAISPAVQVAIQDANGNTVAADTNPVAIALVGSTDLGGTLSVTPQNGVASFSNLLVSNPGKLYAVGNQFWPHCGDQHKFHRHQSSRNLLSLSQWKRRQQRLVCYFAVVEPKPSRELRRRHYRRLRRLLSVEFLYRELGYSDLPIGE